MMMFKKQEGENISSIWEMNARIDPTFLPLLMNSSQVAASNCRTKSPNDSVRTPVSELFHLMLLRRVELNCAALQSSHHEVAMRHDKVSIISSGFNSELRISWADRDNILWITFSSFQQVSVWVQSIKVRAQVKPKTEIWITIR